MQVPLINYQLPEINYQLLMVRSLQVRDHRSQIAASNDQFLVIDN